jgi:hypothetical protein
MKKALITFLLCIFPIICWARIEFNYPKPVPIYAEFINGIKVDDAKACTIKMQSMCTEELDAILKYKEKAQNKDEVNTQEEEAIDIEKLNFTYATCMRQEMQKERICTQSLALLNKLKPNFVEILNIQTYALYDAVETKVNKDDKQKWYFIVNKRGEFVDTRDVHADMKDSTTYPYFIRKYPGAKAGDALSAFPPRFEKLMLGDTRLVFARDIVNKIKDCKQCEVIGTMESGYDFKPNGEFKWVKFIKLTPNGPLPL